VYLYLNPHTGKSHRRKSAIDIEKKIRRADLIENIQTVRGRNPLFVRYLLGFFQLPLAQSLPSGSKSEDCLGQEISQF